MSLDVCDLQRKINGCFEGYSFIGHQGEIDTFL
jgi:hypothetical protein